MTNKQSIQLIFALKVKKSRQDKGLSFAQLATQTGLSVSYLNEIEKGKKYPKADKIILLANALGVSYDWLVSLKLDKRYAQVAKIIRSNILDELPLEMFGIRPTTLLELIAKAPDKLNAFLNTVIEISRKYDMSVENFYRAALRSYQEMHENYMEDIENEAIAFASKYKLPTDQPIELEDVVRILKTRFQCEVDETIIGQNPDLQSLRTIYLEGKPARILLNPNISNKQKNFSLSRELGYKYLKIKDRAYTTRWFEAESFEQLLNHYKASYFAGALLMNQDSLSQDLTDFFAHETWDANKFESLIEKYQVSAETLIHRTTNILTQSFGIKRFFFLRLRQHQDANEFTLDQELHFSGQHAPHGTAMEEHYCRRWISISLLYELADLQAKSEEDNILYGAQISDYMNEDTQYLCLSVALRNPIANQNFSVTIGILVDAHVKKTIKFWNTVPIRKVHSTCERCAAMDCLERAKKPVILERERQILKMKNVLDTLQNAS